MIVTTQNFEVLKFISKLPHWEQKIEEIFLLIGRSRRNKSKDAIDQILSSALKASSRV